MNGQECPFSHGVFKATTFTLKKQLGRGDFNAETQRRRENAECLYFSTVILTDRFEGFFT